MGSRRKLGVGWLAVLVGVAVAGAALAALGNGADRCPECCYRDVTITGAGVWWANGTLAYDRTQDSGYPHFLYINEGPGFTHHIYVWWNPYYSGWQVYAVYNELPCQRNATYVNLSDSPTPPHTGWVLVEVDITNCPVVSGLPAPRLSGGEPCAKLGPGASAGFLDRGWPEGEEPPVVGELVVSATYEVGEMITGCCAVADSSGGPVAISYVTMTWYAVTIGEDFFDIREPIDSRLLYEEDGAFCFSIPTEGFEPGYYDIRLGVPLQDQQWIRVEVVAQAE